MMDPEFREQFEIEYQEFALSEIILQLMEEEKLSVRELAKAAEVAGSGKTAGMSGPDAPRLWAEGQYEQVLQYVAQDVQATATVYQAALQQQGVRWRTGNGRVSRAAGKLLAVRDAFKLPQPDTSWMSRRPWPRTKFVGWMLAASAGE